MKKTKLTLGFSPCPNDTFIFYALLHDKILRNDFLFEQRLHDIETLNQMALRSEFDVTKVSFHAFGHIRDTYCLLRSGGALGRGCGPLVVARETCSLDSLADKRIAAPGRYTTSFLLLQLYNPIFRENVTFMPFHMILESVQKGEVDAGVIIHEGRFTYPLFGLQEILDLGEWWEKETSMPIPLGAIAAKRTLDAGIIRKLESLIQDSIHYAFLHRTDALPYIKAHSQELSDSVLQQHINLYVNDFSRDLGDDGEKAVQMLFQMAEQRGIFPESKEPLFVL